jgi:ribonuclease HI
MDHGQTGHQPSPKYGPTRGRGYMLTSMAAPGATQPGGAGALLTLVGESSATPLATSARYLAAEDTTNNIAEYTALVDGLEMALEFIAQSPGRANGLHITVWGDSMQVVKVMQLRQDCKDHVLAILADKASDLVQSLEDAGCSVSFHYVRRALNKDADGLANRAMDEQKSSQTRTPEFVSARGALPLLDDAIHNPAPATTTRRKGHVPKLAAVPSREEMLGWLADIHRASKVLSRLPPAR